MSKHKHTDKLCLSVMALTLVIAILFMNGAALGIQIADRVMGYETKLFDQSRVHAIDIRMEDWDGFIDSCTNEEYALCDVEIDGETVKNIGIRAKGNTSLSSVASYGNDRYSFKLEFDQYDSMGNYYGLDKLCLNNIIQDNSYLKDYLTYTLMGETGVAAPLCSFVWITVNGEDWGLYLAVEGVEDSFLQRQYGADAGELYKPDSMSMGGGRGNGRDFDINNFFENENGDGTDATPETGQPPESSVPAQNGGAVPNGGRELPEGFDPNQNGGNRPGRGNMGGGMGGGWNGELPEGFDPNQNGGLPDWGNLPEGEMPEGFPGNGVMPEGFDPNQNGGMGGGMGGRGSSDVMLQYIDDDPDSYPNIFGNAKTDITAADQARLIASLKDLSSGEKIEGVVDIEAVIRYLAVHDFVVNGDSYTGSMVHNYYLYEEDGVLSMIPWDYNLAFGSFNMGGMGGFGGNTTEVAGMTASVNSPIDNPVTGGDNSTRPMVAWIFENEEYTALYHQIYGELIETVFDSGYFAQMMADVIALIAPYVEKEPAAFCSYEEFIEGSAALTEFCLLRAQSVSGQLAGVIPSTLAGQTADSSALVDASHLSSSAMGGFGREQRTGNR